MTTLSLSLGKANRWEKGLIIGRKVMVDEIGLAAISS